MRCLLPLLFIAQNPGCPHVGMDSVVGQTGGKVLLTLIFPKTEFMLAFLRDNNTAASVADCFSTLYQGLGSEDFERLFPVFLTDNGTEFSNPKSIEIAPDGHCRSRIFYCNPRATNSGQQQPCLRLPLAGLNPSPRGCARLPETISDYSTSPKNYRNQAVLFAVLFL